MTTASNELFELCKQAYEATGWKDTLGYIQPFGQNVNFPNWFDETITKDHDIAPLYTSDYLLEKLPSRIQDENGNYFSLMGFPNGVQPWFAYKGGLGGEDSRWPINKGIPYYRRVFQANTPLKALLKLTIKLHQENIL